jgi:hypothetical protein
MVESLLETVPSEEWVLKVPASAPFSAGDGGRVECRNVSVLVCELSACEGVVTSCGGGWECDCGLGYGLTAAPYMAALPLRREEGNMAFGCRAGATWLL